MVSKSSVSDESLESGLGVAKRTVGRGVDLDFEDGCSDDRVLRLDRLLG